MRVQSFQCKDFMSYTEDCIPLKGKSCVFFRVDTVLSVKWRTKSCGKVTEVEGYRKVERDGIDIRIQTVHEIVVINTQREGGKRTDH